MPGRTAALAFAAILTALFLPGAGPALGAGTQPTGTSTRDTPVPAGLVRIPAGTYLPIYKPLIRDAQGALVEVDPTAERVASYFLDATPVTNGQFLAFVRAQPQWSRTHILRAFAEPGYLAHWAGPQELGPQAPERAPVVRVSWFAARAYCAWRGARLPTTAEWELAAAASEAEADGRGDPAFRRRILEWYATRPPDVLPSVGAGFRNAFGAYDLHGLVWEWSDDYAFTLDRGESGGRAKRLELTCGGSAIGALDPSDYAAFMRFAFRSSLRGDYTVGSLGFRCALTPP